MKIQCTNCSTVFFIDDSLISGKGVKAQCPRCGHQTVVRSDSSAAAQAPAMGQNLGYNNPASTMGASQPPMGSPPGYNPPPAAGSPQPPPAASVGPGDSFFGDQASYFGGNNNYFGSTGGAQAGQPTPYAGPGAQAGQPTPYAGPGAQADPLRSYTSPAPAPSSPLLPTHLGSPGSSNFEVPNSGNLGIPGNSNLHSANHPASSSGILGNAPSSIADPLTPPQDNEVTRLQPHPSTPYAGTAHEDLGKLDPNWLKIRRIATGEEIGPVSLKEVRSLYVHGKIALDDEYAGEDLEWCPIREVPALLDILQRTPQLGQRGGKIVPPKHVTHRKKPSWILFAGLFLLLLGGGGGAFYYLVILPKNQKKTGKRKGSNPVLSVNLLKDLSKKWEDLHPDIEPDVKESKKLTRKGMSYLARDQRRSYNKAISLFQQALLANIKNHRALAGLAIAQAWKPASRKSSNAAKAYTNTQYEVLLRRQSRLYKTPLLRAAYTLYLKGDPDKALTMAKEAAHKAPREALIQLIAGELWFTQQQDYKKAYLRLRKALKLNKRLARGRVIMAKIMLLQSRYYQATEWLRPLLRRRHIQAMYQQAQLYINQGLYTQGRRLLQRLLKRDRRHHHARLLLATLLYQQLKQKKSAYRYLKVLRKRDRLPRILRLKVLLHRAYIDLLSHRLRSASRRIKLLYKLDKNYLPAKFLEAQVFYARKKYVQALSRLNAVAARLPNDSKVQLLKAIITEKQGKRKQAIGMYRQMADRNSRYIWPRLLLASAYIKEKNIKAVVHLKLSLKVEPALLRNQERPSTYYITPQFWETLLDRFQNARQGPRSIYIAAAGIAYYQIGNDKQAFKQLHRSLKRDAKGLAANLYIAQLYYEKGNLARAQRHARRAYNVYDQEPIAAQILGLVALKRKQYRKAKAYLTAVRRSRPWFISGQIGLALSFYGLKQKEDAMDELKSLLDSYNYHHFLFRALHHLKR